MATCRSANSGRKKKSFSNSKKILNEVEVEEDRISNLPEGILSQILSLLTTNEAIATSVLSRRWRYLWISIINLQFYYEIDVLCKSPVETSIPTKFVDFVNRVFLLHESKSTLKFALNLFQYYPGFPVNKWVCDAVTLSNLRELEMEMHVYYANEMPELPTCVFYCRTLEVFKLSAHFEFNIPKSNTNSICFPSLKVLHLANVCCYDVPSPEEDGFVCFPVLKTLHLDEVFPRIGEDDVGKLVRNCPVLEHLLIRLTYTLTLNMDISAPSLTSFELDFGYEASYYKVQIHAPLLQNLTIKVVTLTNEFIVEKPYSLVDAQLICNCEETFTEEEQNNAYELIKQVDMAQSLFVSSDIVEAIKSGTGVLPLFCNLTHLVVEVSCSVLGVLQCFLENSINLQSLVIRKRLESCEDEEEWWTEPASVPKCLVSTLERVEFENVVGCIDEVALIIYMLKNAKVLERIRIQAFGMKYQKRRRFTQKISSFARGYTECEFIFS